MAKVKTFKPLKSVSEELDFTQVNYPIAVSLKFDGAYGLVRVGDFLGRSLKPMKNKWLTETLSLPKLEGVVGEVCYASIAHMSEDYVPYEDEEYLGLNRQDLCRTTTSKINTIDGGEFPFVWVLFDYVGDGSEEYCYGTPYIERMTDLCNLVDALPNSKYITQHCFADFIYREFMVDGITLLIAEGRVAESAEEMEELYDGSVANGFEGLVGRSLEGVFKFGRATVKTQEFVRFKPSGSSEIIVTEFEPMFQNNNEAKLNELGETERSSHKENKVQLDMVGAMTGIDINTGAVVKIGAGKMDHDLRAEIWNDRENRIGSLAHYKFMNTGQKTLPRHPRFYYFRALSDVELSEEVLAKAKEMGVTPQ